MRLGRITIGRSLLVGVAIVAIAAGLLWSQRRPIASGAIDRALAARGVTASYTITDIGFRTQRIENLRLGDPAHPDLTAAWAEVSLVPTWSGVTVTALNARGVHLRGRITQGRVSWGAVDKLLPAPTGKAFTLPDFNVQLADTRVTLATDMGIFDAQVAGAGKLSDGFQGEVRVAAPFAGRDGCRLSRPTLAASVTITTRQPHFVGAVKADPSSCGGLVSGPVKARFDATFGEGFDRWRGNADVASTGLRQGALQVAQASARVVFSGTATDTNGDIAFAAPAARYGDTRLAGLAVRGQFASGSPSVNGKASIGRVIADPMQVAALRRAFGGAAGTPVGPLADELAKAIEQAGQGAAIDADITYRDGVTRVSAIRVAARGGGVLTLGNGAIQAGREGVTIDADVGLSGGGFPVAQGRLSHALDGSTRGIFRMTDYRAATAQLALSPIRFAARADGTMRIETTATIDGPLGDGRAEGVRVPVVVQRAASGDVLVGPGCTPIAYRRIAISGTTLLPGSVTLCPTRGGALVRSTRTGIGGGAKTGSLRLTGRVGDQPLILATSGASFELGGPLSLANFSAQLGPADRRTQIGIARLDGVTRASGLSGRFTGLSGNIAQVPFLASAGQGDWAFAGGVLDVGGAMMLADQAAVPRFLPLSVQDLKLRLKDGKVAASATLVELNAARALTAVTVSHDLSRVTGEARFTVDGLTFSKSLQPEAITPLTEGVIADLYGTIDGQGVVRWTGDRVTSSGSFRSDGLDFNAAIGPVTGVAGDIVFDDLIALSTPPGQRVKLALVNPGVEVKDGVIDYRLRPNQVVEIERGRWPFAGGELLLDGGSLDFGQTKARTLSFRVVGLDAAKFIEQLKLENIAATGVFDGTLPIVFDASGGQIVGGRIVARAGGGTLAYVGDVSNAQTNTMAKLAFDALKSIRYSNLAIDLDGSLDGEIVSLVRFDGINQSPVAPTGLAKSFTGLPFKFNIRVRAPFRGLVNTARSYQDPGLLLNRTVQPAASDTRP